MHERREEGEEKMHQEQNWKETGEEDMRRRNWTRHLVQRGLRRPYEVRSLQEPLTTRSALLTKVAIDVSVAGIGATLLGGSAGYGID